jgi:hypothetical protein
MLQQHIKSGDFASWFFTSAKSGINITRGINQGLVPRLMLDPDTYKINDMYDDKIITLGNNNSNNNNNNNNNKYCCN